MTTKQTSIRLGSFISARSGLVLSRKEARKEPGLRYPALNLRSVLPDGSIDLAQTDVFVAAEILPQACLTQSGDIIIRLTAPYTAVLIDADTAGLVISSNFLVMRITDAAILPAWLAWYLNTPAIRRAIYANTTSNMLGAVRAGFFTHLEIHLPPLHKQEAMARLHELGRREIRLLHQLAQAKEQYAQLLLEQIYNN